MSRIIDMSGKKYGNLTAIKLVGYKASNNNAVWNFVCDCGNELNTEGYSVRTGKITTCKECGRKRTRAASLKHGLSNTPEFRAWAEIKSRCLNTKSTSYKNYCGRVIKICDRWIDSFENFLADMGIKPTKDHSIDRINNQGNYEPDNCRWSTVLEQANNKRNSVIITFQGVVDTLPGWSRRLGINYAALHQRIRVNKWPIERALTEGINQ